MALHFISQRASHDCPLCHNLGLGEGDARPMRITAIETRVVNAEMRNWVFVRVETDQPGLFGWGEATLEWKTRAVVGAIEDLKPLLLGRDPRDVEQAVRVMKKHSFWRLGAIGMSAISGIEIALWDIAGKALGMPVWKTARRQGSRQGPGLYASRHGRHARRLRNQRRGPAGRKGAGGRRQGLPRFQGGVHPLYGLYRAASRGRQGRADDGGVARRRRPRR